MFINVPLWKPTSSNMCESINKFYSSKKKGQNGNFLYTTTHFQQKNHLRLIEPTSSGNTRPGSKGEGSRGSGWRSRPGTEVVGWVDTKTEYGDEETHTVREGLKTHGKTNRGRGDSSGSRNGKKLTLWKLVEISTKSP